MEHEKEKKQNKKRTKNRERRAIRVSAQCNNRIWVRIQRSDDAVMQPDIAGPRGVSNGVLIAMLCNISSWQLKCGGDGDGAMFTDRSTQTATSSSDLT
mmetsp:Transcript_43611/g.66118  ORF Transcript_43611/g.66118 Transcript_43611/m.66118 type:complete len:98 (-) Transcript_43611:19-312(-)